ncbi:MAG: topoisomerase C-terminal repeat-containing protein, partial [Cutibacterium granulosum]|nr:topoisomerase C-terminal repeat-containing protein [Cutibacterium granulosum]
PYLKKGTDSRSLTSEEQIFTITTDEALAIYAQPKKRGRAAAKPPLRELGEDPNSKLPIVVKDGRFGPYVTDGKTNATLRKEDSVDQITPERAQELLAEKRAKGPSTRRRTTKRRTTTKRKTSTSTKKTGSSASSKSKASSAQKSAASPAGSTASKKTPATSRTTSAAASGSSSQ